MNRESSRPIGLWAYTPLSMVRSTRRDWRRDATHLLVGAACGAALAVVFVRWAGEREEPDVARYREVRDFVESRFVRDVSPEELLDLALDGMVESLDPYSRYYDNAEVAELSRETSGHYEGIGVVFARPTTEGRILFALPGSPAERAGIRTGDRIVEVAGRSTEAMEPGELQRAIADAPARDLRMVAIGRDDSERTIELDKERLIDPTVRHGHMVDPERGVGYLAITSFSQETVNEFDAEVEALREDGMRALVVDVRGNLGGVLRSAVDIANRFVREGLVVSHEGRGETVVFEADPDQAALAGLPLCVLVDGDSASASEVFAAALQEHRAAAIVGSPTYGKGMVQQVKSIAGGEMVVKLTTSYYFTPSHRNIERTVDNAWNSGLLPDLEVPLSDAERLAVLRHLASYSPPRAVLPELYEWEREERRSLVPSHPPDAQLDAALELFRGRRPGAWIASVDGTDEAPTR